MGEANRKGSFEHRKDMAIKREHKKKEKQEARAIKYNQLKIAMLIKKL